MPPRQDFDKRWQPPSKDENPRSKMAWISDVVATGEYNLQTTGFKEIGPSIDMISGRTGAVINQSRSKLNTNRGKRALKTNIANISDIRPIDAFSSDNPAVQDFLAMYNKVWKAVYFESKLSVKMKRAIQWLTVGGVSYVSPVYRNTRLAAKSAKRIDYDAFSVADCLPFQLPSDNNVQGAYAWTIIRFMPEFEAHAKFPRFQSQLRPVAKRRYSGNAAKDRLALAERFRFGDDPSPGVWAQQYDEIRYTYVNDLSINETKKPIAMGKPNSLESYIVPFVGMEIPTGEFNMGVRLMRKATEEDCYLYPNKRLMISQRGMQTPMYDGPAFDWHGMFPLVRFSADEWPWEPGYSASKEIFSVELTRQSFERGLDQTAKARFDPALIYDKNSMPRKTAEQFDPYEERGRLGLEDASENAVRTALPEELLNMPSWAFEWTKYLSDSEDYLLGQDALNNLARAKIAAMSGDALEQALEESGPIVKDISHSMEAPMEDLMMMTLYDVFQYYPAGRIMQYVGPNGVAKETFDLDPSALTPAHAFGVENPSQLAELKQQSAFTKMERCQMFLANIHAQITPGSLHGVVQTPQKLLMMQLQRAGFMISSETVAKALDIPNFGTFEGNTELEKWQSEQEMKLEFAVKMQQIQQALTQPQPLQPPALQPVPVSPLLSGKPEPGRPPTGNKPPELKTKGSAEGPRAVITESH